MNQAASGQTPKTQPKTKTGKTFKRVMAVGLPFFVGGVLFSAGIKLPLPAIAGNTAPAPVSVQAPTLIPGSF